MSQMSTNHDKMKNRKQTPKRGRLNCTHRRRRPIVDFVRSAKAIVRFLIAGKRQVHEQIFQLSEATLLRRANKKAKDDARKVRPAQLSVKGTGLNLSYDDKHLPRRQSAFKTLLEVTCEMQKKYADA